MPGRIRVRALCKLYATIASRGHRRLRDIAGPCAAEQRLRQRATLSSNVRDFRRDRSRRALLVDDNRVHADARVDPASASSDHTYLIVKDLESVQKRLDRSRRAAKTGDAAERLVLGVCEKLAAALDGGKRASTVKFDDERDLAVVHDLQLITRKPMFYVCNVKEDQLGKLDSDPMVAKVRRSPRPKHAEEVVCAAIEAESCTAKGSARFPRVGRLTDQCSTRSFDGCDVDCHLLHTGRRKCAPGRSRGHKGPALPVRSTPTSSAVHQGRSELL